MLRKVIEFALARRVMMLAVLGLFVGAHRTLVALPHRPPGALRPARQ